MSVIEKLKTETMKLRKNRSSLGPTMQFHLAEISKIGKSNGNRETTEVEAIQYLKKAVQKMTEDKYSNLQEIDILEALLPQMTSKDDVQKFLETVDTSNKGAVMKAVKAEFGALVDMKMVSELL